jgi:DNA repair photolyase
MSKLIYEPKASSKAEEYSKYAISFYEGCTEPKCSYCYMVAMSNRFGKYFGKARLKEWLIDENNQ